MPRKAFTGGPLNVLNGRIAGISAPHNSVSVSGLIRSHSPKSESELEGLIASHIGGGCSCGIESKGTVQDFGRNLYEAQKIHWGEYRFSLVECIQWEYDLFIIQMLKGATMEDKGMAELSHLLPDELLVRASSSFVDEELRVDLEVLHGDEAVAGVQVKPESFSRVDGGIRGFNKTANAQYGKPVLYLYYNYETELFANLDAVVASVRECIAEDT